MKYPYQQNEKARAEKIEILPDLSDEAIEKNAEEVVNILSDINIFKDGHGEMVTSSANERSFNHEEFEDMRTRAEKAEADVKELSRNMTYLAERILDVHSTDDVSHLEYKAREWLHKIEKNYTS